MIWRCNGCRKQFSVKVGTIFEDSPLSLTKWIPAMWLIANAKNGISSYELHRALGVTQKTAWFMLHRIRLAMQNGTLEKLGEDVEIDETYIGGKARNMHKEVRAKKITGTGGKDKAVVFGMLERGGEVRLQHVERPRKKTLEAIINQTILPGSRVYTDALQSYNGLGNWYRHQVIDHSVAYVEGLVHTNGMENFWSCLKRTINGTYVSVEPFHLHRYLDEQAFRFNERKGTDADRFFTVASQVSGKRLTYKRLTGKELAIEG
jgi:transposase-like protein